MASGYLGHRCAMATAKETKLQQFGAYRCNKATTEKNCSTQFGSHRYNNLQSFNELPDRRVQSESWEMRLSCQRMVCSNSKANKHADDHYAEYTYIYSQPREVY